MSPVVVQVEGLGSSTPGQRVAFSLLILGMAAALWAPVAAGAYLGSKTTKKRSTGAIIGGSAGLALSTAAVAYFAND